MPLATSKSGKCAFCAFGIAEWLAPSIGACHNARFYSQKHKDKSSGLFRTVKSGRGGDLTKDHLRAIDQRQRRNALRGSPRNPSLSVTPVEVAAGVRKLLNRDEVKYSIFEGLVLEQYALVMRDYTWSKSGSRSTLEAWGLKTEQDLKRRTHEFKMQISKSLQKAHECGITDKKENPLFHRLRHAFVSADVEGLTREIKYAFINSVVETKFSPEDFANQKRLADLRYPIEWYPATRAMQRTVHLHVGPTNSGKTYHALQKLEAAETGIYAGPLRLLAHEVYTRFNAKGKPCALITGEERRIPENLKAVMNSCTVEMVPLNAKVDVAVIDEIQMMGDAERGWAWTQAFLGVQAKELHLCGELRTIQLVTDLCAAMGEKLEVHRYERLNPLMPSTKHLGNLSNLRKGDAVIVFSRVGIHAMKNDIEAATRRRCAVVYGSLPPETRAQQANLFNDPNNDYDFLVASDAVGMGLNLSIKRVIFESTTKRDGVGFRLIGNSELKQIAGRAGRYKTALDAVQVEPTDEATKESSLDITYGQSLLQIPTAKAPKRNVGYVTTIEKFDLPIVRQAMQAEVEPLKTAGIFPPTNILQQFASYFPPKTPFSYILLRLHDISAMHSRFHMCRLVQQVDIADVIQPYNLTINDRIIFMASPASIREPGCMAVIQEMAQCVAEQSGGALLDLKSMYLELLDIDKHEYYLGAAKYLKAAEALHKALTLYLWLSYRFAGVFTSQALAFHVKGLVEKKIDECLAEVGGDMGRRKHIAILRQKQLERQARLLVDRPEGYHQGEEQAVDEGQGEEEEGDKVDGSRDSLSGGVNVQLTLDGLQSLEQMPEFSPSAIARQGGQLDTRDSEDSSASAACVPLPPAVEETLLVERGPI